MVSTEEPPHFDGRRYYNPTRHGVEERYADRVEKIRALLSPAEPGLGAAKGQDQTPEPGREG